MDFDIILQFVPLHPEQICPNDKPLLRRNHESGAYESYVARRDGLFRKTNDPNDTVSPPLHVFEHQSVRSEGEKLNIWLVMLNAEVKFSRFRKNYGLWALHSDLRPAVEETIEIVDLIYRRLDLRNVVPQRRSTRTMRNARVNYAEYEDSGSDTEREMQGRASGKLTESEGAQPRPGGSQEAEVVDRWTSDLASRPGRPPCAFFIGFYRTNLIVTTQ